MSSADTASDAVAREHARLLLHLHDCRACRNVGGEDAPRSALCPSADWLYQRWESAIRARNEHSLASQP